MGLDRTLVDNVLSGEWLDNGGVDDLGTTESWDTNVKQEDGLEEKVEWHPVQDGSGPELNDIEEGENNPVGQQLGVVVLTSSLQGNQGEVTGNNETSNIGQQLANTTNVQENDNEVEHTEAQNSVGSRQASLLFKHLQWLDTSGSLKWLEFDDEEDEGFHIPCRFWPKRP